jgi:hypothetical protein
MIPENFGKNLDLVVFILINNNYSSKIRSVF